MLIGLNLWQQFPWELHVIQLILALLVCMYRLERLVEGVFFEVLNQEKDSVGIDPCFATVVAGSESVGC